MLIGYARVSTTEQETNLQLDALKRAGVEQVFSEKRSSAASRPMLAACIDHTRPGDTLMVYKIDRLARSLKDLLALLDRLDVRGVGFKSCTEPIDTTSPAGRMMMQMLGAFAEFERGMIGRARAMTPSEEREAVRKVAAGEMTKSGAARLYGCHISSIKRAMRRPENRPTKP